MNRITTDTLLRNELFRKSEFSGNSVVIPYTSEGAAAKMKRLEVIETRQEKREGYNLLKLVDKTKEVFGLTHVIKDGKITSTGTSTKSYADIGSDRDSFEIKLEAEKTYTFMRTEASFCSIAIKLYSDKNDLTSFETFTIPAYQTKTTFAPTRNTEFCYLFLGSFTAGTEFNLKEYGVMVYEGTENKEFEQYGTMPSLEFSSEIESVGDNVKLEKGTKSTSYSEFGQGSVEIRKSKANVYDISKFTQGFWNSAANTGVTGWLCKVVKGQKVIVNKKNNKLDYVIGLTTLDYRDSTNVRISESGWQSGEKFEMTAIDDGYIFLQVKKNNNSNITSAELLADGFEIYCVNKTHILQIQRKMLKGDYFDIANKKEVHKWDKVILTGDENISMSNSQNVNYFGINSITLEDFEYIDDNTTNYMCTHFNAIKVSERYKYNTMFINSAKRIVLCCNEFSNVDDFKVKLAELYNEGKAVEIYYKLATPLELDCTEEQIAVLTELENMTTYADKTIIAIDNDLSEMTLEVEQSRISMIEEKLKKEETV